MPFLQLIELQTGRTDEFDAVLHEWLAVETRPFGRTAGRAVSQSANLPQRRLRP